MEGCRAHTRVTTHNRQDKPHAHRGRSEKYGMHGKGHHLCHSYGCVGKVVERACRGAKSPEIPLSNSAPDSARGAKHALRVNTHSPWNNNGPCDQNRFSVCTCMVLLINAIDGQIRRRSHNHNTPPDTACA